jgi:EpsI family protein
MLFADHNVQRAYYHPLGYTIYVYLGDYGSHRGGTPEHTPDVCYPSQGWEIVESSKRRVGGNDGLALCEYVVEKDGTRRLVHFWYRTSIASGITSILDLRINHFWGRLTNVGSDGALIRLSTSLPDGEYEAARERLFALDLKVEAELRRLWPVAPTAESAANEATGRSGQHR